MITLQKLAEPDLYRIWQQGYSTPNPKWTIYDAPFLHTYHQSTWELFKLKETAFFLSKHVKGIFMNGEVIGALNFYWENERTRWLEIGLVIFSEENWSKGYGSQAIKEWTSEMFSNFPEIQRVGFTTWSGNPGMIQIGKKNHFTQEAKLRQVRYFEGTYYDEIRFGLLRSEWERLF